MNDLISTIIGNSIAKHLFETSNTKVESLDITTVLSYRSESRSLGKIDFKNHIAVADSQVGLN